MKVKRQERKHNLESGHEKWNNFFLSWEETKKCEKIGQEKGKLKVRKYGSVNAEIRSGM